MATDPLAGVLPVQLQPIDLTALLAVFMGISVVLIPIIGITARFALKPTVEAMSRFFEGKGKEESLQILERRMALVEQQMDQIDSSVRRLADVAEFHAQLDVEQAADSPALAAPTAPRPDDNP